MSYTVLARKYRPETFDDVVGQDWIARTLSNAIRKNRIAHAFLFSGPRGVGKTSMARILSKALNCAEGPTPTPCLKCEQCLSIARGGGVDVVEIDAASNRGIDHIRALRENVRYVPVGSRFKIYIIDEVHMLTPESFNALLKTLEEPPPHVKFIFATTEPQKMPETVRSRCQCYDFRRIGGADIASKLEDIAGKEKIACESGVLQRIAILAQGGLRDAESLLDQVAALGGGKATFAALNALTGRLSPGEISDLVDAVLSEDAAAILRFVEKVFRGGTQGEDLLKDLVDYLRALMLRAADPSYDLGPMLPGLEERAAGQAERTDLDTVLAHLQIALETLRKARWFDDVRILTEMALLKMATLSRTLSLEGALETLSSSGPAAPTGKPAAAKAPPPRRAAPPRRPEAPAEAPSPPPRGAEGNPGGAKSPDPLPGPRPQAASSAQEYFFKVIEQVEMQSKTLGSFLRKVEKVSLEGSDFELALPAGEGGGLFSLENRENQRRLEKAAERALGAPYRFRVRKTADGGEEIPPVVRKTLERFEGDLM